MPITAKFEADFVDFNRGVQTAQAQLRGFETSTTRAATSLNLTTTTVGRTSQAFGALSTGLGQVDRTLAAFGMNIGPQVSALREMEAVTMAAAGGFSAIGIAALATGGLILAATTDWNKVNQAIANATASLMGWGDLNKETALAVAQNAAATKRAAEEEKELAAEQKRSAEQRAKFVAQWQRDVDQRNRLAVEERQKQEEEARKAAEAKSRTEKEWRDYQNFLGERYMEDEAARQAKVVADHKAATEAKIAEEQRWWDVVHQGMLITDPTLGEKSGLVIFNEKGELVPTTPGTGVGFRSAPTGGAAPFSLGSGSPMKFGFTGQGGMVINNTVNAQGGFFQDNASVNRLATLTGDAIMAKIRAQGGRA